MYTIMSKVRGTKGPGRGFFPVDLSICRRTSNFPMNNVYSIFEQFVCASSPAPLALPSPMPMPKPPGTRAGAQRDKLELGAITSSTISLNLDGERSNKKRIISRRFCKDSLQGGTFRD